MKKNRVVITGISILSPIGCYPGTYWEHLLAGKNGISDLQIEHFCKCYSKKYGLLDKQLLNQLEETHLSKTEQTLHPCSKLALTAAIMAANDAKLSFSSLEEKMAAGVFMGSTLSDRYLIDHTEADHRENKFSAVLEIAKHFDLHGAAAINANACASGNLAIGAAAERIRRGELEVVLAGGADLMSEIGYVIFIRLKALSDDSVKPFDRHRNGTILSEGAAFLVLESLEHAQKRKATIYGEVLGYGQSNDAYHIVTPDPSAKGVEKAMQQAIEQAGISKNAIDLIALHGTGTPANDAAENKAIDAVFGTQAEAISGTAIKSVLGHQLGAASAVSMATNALILKHGVIPPTRNVSDPEELAFHFVKDQPEFKKVQMILNNAYAFGGSNCCVILKRWENDHD